VKRKTTINTCTTQVQPDKPCTTIHHLKKKKKKTKTPKTNTSLHCLPPCFCIVMFNGPSPKDTKCHVLIQTTTPTLSTLSLSLSLFSRRQKETASLFSSLSSSLTATHSMLSVLSVCHG